MRSDLVALALGAILIGACSKSSPGAGSPAPGPSSVVAPASGAVAVTADARGFTPSEIKVAKGQTLSLLFTRTTDDTCAKEVVFPQLRVRTPLPLRSPVAVVVPTDTPGSYRFQCPMGMWEGAVVVQ